VGTSNATVSTIHMRVMRFIELLLW
jgi:hypothetical protein